MISKEVHDVIRSLPDACFLIAETGEIMAVNPAASKMLGQDAASLVGRQINQLVTGPADKVLRYLRIFARNRDPIPGAVTWHKNKNEVVECRCNGHLLQAGSQGSPPLILMRCRPRYAAGNRFLALNKTLEELRASYHSLSAKSEELKAEIAERKRIEDTLRESERRFRHITEAITDYIYSVRVEGGKAVETRHGVGCYAVTGYREDEFAHDPYLWILMVAEEDREAVAYQARHALAGEAVPAVEHRLIRKDGSLRWVRNTIVPRRDAGGRLQSYDGLIQDITERKQAEEALRKNEKKIRDIASSLGEGIYVLGPKGEVTFMNPEAEHLLGWTEAELLNKNIHDIIHNRKLDGTPLSFKECQMHNVIKTGSRFLSHDELFIRKDGSAFPVTVISTPLMEKGKIVSSVTAFRDISESKQSEQEREKLIEELQKLLAEIKTLRGILPICSSCKRIRDDKGAWTQMEAYISEHTQAEFSHGLCAECAKKLYPDYYKEKGPSKT